jgi:hypothetical protein
MLEHELLKRNVNEHTEKKQNLTYLSWAWAWAEALKVDPAAHFHVRTFDTKDGEERCWMDVNGTAMVWVEVILGSRSRTCFLPVMDHRNKPIQNPDAFQVNTAIMRCMTKCLSLFGLGLYIYAGEDLPEDGEVKEEKKEEKKKPEFSAQDKENLVLFGDTLLQYIEIQRSEADLKSYWKSNQAQIDKVKAHLPDLYDIIVTKFKEAKANV